MEGKLEIICDHNSWLYDKYENYRSFNCEKEELNDFLCKYSRVEFKKKNKTIMLAVIGEKIVGFIAYSIDQIGASFSDEEGIPHIKIEGFAVDKAYRGNGYGQMLMLEVIKNAYEIERMVCLQGIYLTSYKEAVDYYINKFSFEVINKYAMYNNDPDIVIPMRLDIGAIQDIVHAVKSKVTYTLKK